jgi:DNA-binding protein WhiA
MSFSIKVKNEILLLSTEKTEKISLLSAYIRNNAVITETSILINTENIELSKYIYNLLRELYNIIPSITLRKNFNFKKNSSYLIKINNQRDVILKDLSLINEDGYFINIPREYVYEDEDEKQAYLRGLFIATGSVNDPNTARYHLEFLIDDYDYALFVCELLDDYNLNSKLIERNNGFMVYIKEAEKISDFLKVLKAYNSVLYYENIKAYREEKNLINRLNNCEQANVEKTINSANEQIKDIEHIENTVGLDALDEKLKTVAIYRKKYKEVSLSELSKIISIETNTNLSKSGINHRIRKIKEIANNINKEEV